MTTYTKWIDTANKLMAAFTSLMISIRVTRLEKRIQAIEHRLTFPENPYA